MRLFIAAWPPAEVVDALAELPRAETAGVRWTTRDQWHVTLRFLGELDEPGPVADALRAATLPPARARLGPAAVRIGADVAAFPVSGLDRLAAAVTAATATFGRPPGRRFRGHLTVARSRRGRLDLPAGLTLTAAWDVTAVDLVRSDTHPDGARYRTVVSVPIAGG